VKCNTVIRDLSDYLDNELDAETMARIEEHLSRCEDCRLLIDTTKKTIQIFCNSEPIALPDDVHERLHRALVQRLKHPHS
jgi:predicted anti-sigma-YlaC factor YlaD